MTNLLYVSDIKIVIFISELFENHANFDNIISQVSAILMDQTILPKCNLYYVIVAISVSLNLKQKSLFIIEILLILQITISCFNFK